MSSYVIVNNSTVSIKEYKGQRVVTFKEIDAVHGRPDGTAYRNFAANRDRFITGEDYFSLSPQDIQSTNFVDLANPRGLTLITESGYLMLVKSFTDDLAWRVQRELVNSYFRRTGSVSPAPMSTAEMFLAQAKAMVELEQQSRAITQRLDTQQQTLEKAVSVFTLPTVEVEHWRDEMNTHISRVCETYGLSQQVFRGETYAELEDTANVILSSRVKRKKERMRKAGAKYRDREAITKLHVISEDEKLRAIYESIIRKRESQLCVSRHPASSPAQKPRTARWGEPA